MTDKFSFSDVCNLLDDLNFDKFIDSNLRKFDINIDYGSKAGKRTFKSIPDAAESYLYTTKENYKIHIDKQHGSLDDATDYDLLIFCIEVFDWGNVQSGNILQAIVFHRNGTLKKELQAAKKYFEDDSKLLYDNGKSNIPWTSGWTKVFSFISDKTVIYDSRVAAYINYIFTTFYYSITDEEQKSKLLKLLRFLKSFNGQNRSRLLTKECSDSIGITRSVTKNNGYTANKLASWIARYLCEKIYSSYDQKDFRSVDKSFFMLGFDMNQLDGARNYFEIKESPNNS